MIRLINAGMDCFDLNIARFNCTGSAQKKKYWDRSEICNYFELYIYLSDPQMENLMKGLKKLIFCIISIVNDLFSICCNPPPLEFTKSRDTLSRSIIIVHVEVKVFLQKSLFCVSLDF